MSFTRSANGRSLPRNASQSRAANRLCDAGTINGWDILLPTYFAENGGTRDYRHVFCVSSLAITEVTEEHVQNAANAKHRVDVELANRAIAEAVRHLGI
jgi:hypothetical protein